MRKILILTCGILVISFGVLAEETTCANGAGTIVEGVVTGHKYCKSNITMNWWNAMAWCDGIGRQLFGLDDCRCSATTTVCSDKKCPELVGIGNDGYTWTRTPSSDILAYLVQLPSGGIDANYRNGYFGYYYAVCK